MRIDCHLHTQRETSYGDYDNFDSKKMLCDLKKAGMDGAAIYSLSPITNPDKSVEERMSYALNVCKNEETLFPFFWIDPMEEDALSQVDLAVEKGFVAFKMIPSTYNVGCQKSLDVIEKIAAGERQ